MSNLKDFLARLMLAFSLLCGAGAATAGPIYSVRIDTATLGGGPAYLGLYFIGLADAAQASATVSNLAGALAGPADVTGAITGTLPGPLEFSNAGGGSELVQAITLGGVFSFDVTFMMGAGDVGTTFGGRCSTTPATSARTATWARYRCSRAQRRAASTCWPTPARSAMCKWCLSRARYG